MSFFKKFFGYFTNEDGGISRYSDGLGKGAFSDWRHFAWIILVFVLGVLIYKLAKKYPHLFKKIMIVVVCLLFGTRLINQIVNAIVGMDNPPWRAFPFHLCTVMTFLLPIVVFFDIKKLKTSVYALSMMGGFITAIIGDYFDSRFMTFAVLEGITAHTLLIFIPLIDIALGNFRIEFKKIWQVFVGIVILLIWATLANEVFFKNYDTNYMFLVRNGLPGDIGGDYYFLIYAAIFLVLLAFLFGVPAIYRKIIEKKQNKIIG